MLASLQNLLLLSQSELIVLSAVVLLAALVRGFAGFGLSALIMAGAALIIPPVTLIPVCFTLEAVASALMIRGGFRQADKATGWGLAIGSAVGLPIGLMATVNVPVDTSRFLALLLILVLAALQLYKASPAFLATRAGLYSAGLASGIATGLASVGGMVVALYILAQNAEPARMRATLILYLFLSMFSFGLMLLLSGLLNELAFLRALFLVPVTVAGVLLGRFLFRPSLESIYKRFCLFLVMALALIGLARMISSY